MPCRSCPDEYGGGRTVEVDNPRLVKRLDDVTALLCDTLGFAAKGAWFEADGKQFNIYKDPITDDGTKKSLKGLCGVFKSSAEEIELGQPEYICLSELTPDQENQGLLQVIYEDGKFYNQTTLTEVRSRLQSA